MTLPHPSLSWLHGTPAQMPQDSVDGAPMGYYQARSSPYYVVPQYQLQPYPLYYQPAVPSHAQFPFAPMYGMPSHRPMIVMVPHHHHQHQHHLTAAGHHPQTGQQVDQTPSAVIMPQANDAAVGGRSSDPASGVVSPPI